MLPPKTITHKKAGWCDPVGYITWDAMPVTTRVITFFGSGILINLHLPLPIRG